MNKRILNIFRTTCVFAVCANTVLAQFIDFSDDRVKTPLDPGLKQIGAITPRTTKEIKSSRITIGCEVLDRDLAVFDNYKTYLPYLGAKKARIQAGWGKCEKVPGVYDWKWLDDIIDYLVANDIEPWFELSYGNPAYPGGGGTGLLNSLMTSEEAYQAWDRWVEAAVTRYKDRVTEWEIWNEPDHPMQKIEPETTADLNIRTAKIIKRIQPEAEIAGLAFASNSNKRYLTNFLQRIKEKGNLSDYTWISYHSYNWRPEDAYSEKAVLGLREIINRYNPNIKLRQGENGAPSTYIPSFALAEYYWTEYTQAKYDMRRLLGDLGHDIETSVFTIIDINYNPVINTKGLILSDTTKAAIRPKVAYYAVQNLTAVFDDEMRLCPDVKFTHNFTESLSLYAYKHEKTNLITLWNDSKIPSNDFSTKHVNLTAEGCTFKKPVWVDLMTGKIYEIPSAQWKNRSGSCTFSGLPVYDSPVLICEKDFILKKH